MSNNTPQLYDIFSYLKIQETMFKIMFKILRPTWADLLVSSNMKYLPVNNTKCIKIYNHGPYEFQLIYIQQNVSTSQIK